MECSSEVSFIIKGANAPARNEPGHAARGAHSGLEGNDGRAACIPAGRHDGEENEESRNDDDGRRDDGIDLNRRH